MNRKTPVIEELFGDMARWLKAFLKKTPSQVFSSHLVKPCGKAILYNN